MKNLLLVVLALGLTAPAFAEQTVGEKAEVHMKDAKRSMKKGMHRTKEAVCMKGDAKCAADKMANRAEEAKDATVDKVDELKDKVDKK